MINVNKNIIKVIVMNADVALLYTVIYKGPGFNSEILAPY